MMTGIDRRPESSLSLVSIVTPSMTGIVRSRMMRSGFSRAAWARPSSPLAASMTWQSNREKVRPTIMRIVRLSSTLRILIGIGDPLGELQMNFHDNEFAVALKNQHLPLHVRHRLNDKRRAANRRRRAHRTRHSEIAQPGFQSAHEHVCNFAHDIVDFSGTRQVVRT